jgi:hypothetical protein
MTRPFAPRGANQYLSGFFCLSAQTPRKDEGIGAMRANPNLSALAWRRNRTASRYAMSGVLKLDSVSKLLFHREASAAVALSFAGRSVRIRLIAVMTAQICFIRRPVRCLDFMAGFFLGCA